MPCLETRTATSEKQPEMLLVEELGPHLRQFKGEAQKGRPKRKGPGGPKGEAQKGRPKRGGPKGEAQKDPDLFDNSLTWPIKIRILLGID